MIIMKVFITHLDQNLMIKMINIKQKKKKKQYRQKTPKCVWLFQKFKSRDKRFDRWNKRCRRWHWQQKASFYW